MTTMTDHLEPPAAANGHALVPFTFPPGPVSGWPQDDPGQPRTPPDRTGRRHYPWPLMLIAAPAAVAVWSGWVGLGGMCGFGPVRLLPGIADGFTVNTAITLPVGVEAYGAYALYVWLAGKVSAKTREFARNSAFAALGLGCLGQVVYHLLAAARWAEAPWGVVVAVSCLPVLTLSFAAALVHMTLADTRGTADDPPPEDKPEDKPADSTVDRHVDRQVDKPPPRKAIPARTAMDKAAAAIRDNPGLAEARAWTALAGIAGVSAKTVKRAMDGTAKTP